MFEQNLQVKTAQSCLLSAKVRNQNPDDTKTDSETLPLIHHEPGDVSKRIQDYPPLGLAVEEDTISQTSDLFLSYHTGACP